MYCGTGCKSEQTKKPLRQHICGPSSSLSPHSALVAANLLAAALKAARPENISGACSCLHPNPLTACGPSGGSRSSDCQDKESILAPAKYTGSGAQGNLPPAALQATVLWRLRQPVRFTRRSTHPFSISVRASPLSAALEAACPEIFGDAHGSQKVYLGGR